MDVVLYVRPDCHLCSEAEALLARVAAEIGVDWRAVSIEDDEALEARYGESIPVLAVDGEPVLYAPFGESLLRWTLERRTEK